MYTEDNKKNDKQFFVAFVIWIVVVAVPIYFLWPLRTGIGWFDAIYELVLVVFAFFAMVLVHPIKTWLQITFSQDRDAR